MLKLKNRQRGDTIVEVMVALAVLSLAFSVAYATANKALLQARNAQEHTEALQYLSSQIELLRSHNDDPKIFAAGTFCMDSTPAPAPPAPPPASIVVRPIVAALCTVTPTGSAANYALSIDWVNVPVSGADQDTFTLNVKWQGVGSFGPQQEQLFYKVHTR